MSSDGPRADRQQAQPVQRVLLVEFTNADQFPGRVSLLFPFIAGYLDSLGAPSRWIRYAIATTNKLAHGCDEVTLTPEELEHLLSVVRAFGPTLVVHTDPLAPIQHSLVEAAATCVGFVREKEFRGTPGGPLFLGTQHLSEPDFRPRYVWEPGNQKAGHRVHDNIYLGTSEACGHYLPIAANTRYESLAGEPVYGHRGCAFCMSSSTRPSENGSISKAPAPTPLGWFTRQLEAIARDASACSRYPNAVLLETLSGPEVLEHCARIMESAGLSSTVALLAAVRTNRIGEVAEQIRHFYTSRPDSVLRVGVYASGIESFSKADLELFNKGTLPWDCIRAVNLLRELADEFPGRFSYNGLSFVLLTPWTTPESLALNLGTIRLLGLTRSEAGNIFQSRLRLHEGLPITRLAEQQGLLLSEEPDPFLVLNRRKLFDRERAWTFSDRRMSPLARVMMRLEFLGQEMADDLTRDVERHLCRGPTVGTPGDEEILDLLQCHVDVVCRTPSELDASKLLREAADLRERRLAAFARPPARDRFRIGEERLTLRGLLERLLPLVSSGLRTALVLEDVLEDEIDDDIFGRLRAGGLHVALLPPPPDSGPSRRSLGVASSADDMKLVARLLRSARTTADSPERRSALERLLQILGAPPCCARATAQGPFASLHVSRWGAVALRRESTSSLPPALNPFLAPAVSFLPCSPSCALAGAVYQATASALAVDPAPFGFSETAHLVTLDPFAEDEFVTLRLRSVDDSVASYDRSSISAGGGMARNALRCGDRLEVLPGQLRVWNGADLVELFTGTHLLWAPARSWHAREWAELANGVAFSRRRRAPGASQPAPSAGSPATSHRVGAPMLTSAPASNVETVGSGISRRIASALEGIREQLRDRTGFELADVRADVDGPRVVLRRDAEEIRLTVFPATSTRPAYCRGRRFALCYDQPTPVDRRDKALAVAIVHRHLEHHAERAAVPSSGALLP